MAPDNCSNPIIMALMLIPAIIALFIIAKGE